VETGAFWDLTPAMSELRGMGRQMVLSAPMVLLGLLVLLVVLAAARMISPFLGRLLTRRSQSEIVRGVVEKAVFALQFVIGLYVFLRISGLTRVAATILGGSGIAGLVMGFAFRDIAENFLASLLISIQRPFRIGDTIEIGGHRGVVQRVTIRGTVLMDFEGNHIQLTNSSVYKGTIKNYTANPKQRLDFAVGIGYDANISDAQKLVKDVLDAHSAVLDDPEPQVLVEELGSATVRVRVYAWIDGQVHSKPRVLSALMRLVLGALDEAGVSMPDEAREVVFPEGVVVHTAEPEARASEPTVDRRDQASGEGAVEKEEVTEAEGSLRSEVQEIQEQARNARQPEQGADVLAT
jgi:small-conductance mechanosensitive channel